MDRSCNYAWMVLMWPFIIAPIIRSICSLLFYRLKFTFPMYSNGKCNLVQKLFKRRSFNQQYMLTLLKDIWCIPVIRCWCVTWKKALIFQKHVIKQCLCLVFVPFWSLNMCGFSLQWPTLMSHEVKLSPIGLHMFHAFINFLGLIYSNSAKRVFRT